MGRPLRIEFEGALYHVTSRGNEKKEIFIDASDRKKFIDILRDYHERLRAVYHCFILMNNHYHLLLETPLGNLTTIVHGINSCYTGYFNRKYNRIGHLFQGRYKAIVVEKETYLLEVSRYIHLNPIRAGICKRPEDFFWSSYHGYLHPKERLAWIEYDWTLKQFHQDEAEAVNAYKEFIEDGLGKNVLSPLKDVVGGVILGKDEFVRKMKERIKGMLSEEIVKREELVGFPSPEIIMEKVAKYYGVPVEQLKKKGKGNLPRKVAIYFIYQKSGLTNHTMAKLFGGIHYTTITQTIKRLQKNQKFLEEAKTIDRLIDIPQMSHVKT